MNDANILDKPTIHPDIEKKCLETGFSMPSDLYIGTLLKTLITSRQKGRFLELGTGIGLSLSWMIDGMDSQSELITVDNDPELSQIARDFFGRDPRVTIVCADGADWLRQYRGAPFDLIFADAWPGKYSHLEETLALLKVGGFYVIDDMQVQPNWPEGHQDKAAALIGHLEHRQDLNLTKMNWSTGLIVAVKKG